MDQPYGEYARAGRAGPSRQLPLEAEEGPGVRKGVIRISALRLFRIGG